MIELLRRSWVAVQPWVQRNVTFGLVLAIATEAPRWVFAFVGAHEPVWAGVAVAVLMAFAAAQGWDEYFRQRDKLLLSMLIGQIASAMIIITPVVFAMAMGAGHEVQIRDIVAPWFLWVWAGTLVVSTFLPLVVVAYVEVQRHGRMHPPTAPIKVAKVQPAIITVPALDAPAPVTPVDVGAVDKKARALQLLGEGLTVAEVAKELCANPNTVKAWKARYSNGAKEKVQA